MERNNIVMQMVQVQISTENSRIEMIKVDAEFEGIVSGLKCGPISCLSPDVCLSARRVGSVVDVGEVDNTRFVQRSIFIPDSNLGLEVSLRHRHLRIIEHRMNDLTCFGN